MQQSAKTILLLLGLAVIFAALGYAVQRKVAGATGQSRQAVFLINGAAYFGYIKANESDYVIMDDVYYSPTTEGLIPDGQDTKKRLTLLRFSKEPYGPKGEIRINRQNILFFAPIREDSKINEAIQRDKDVQASPTPLPSLSPSSTP